MWGKIMGILILILINIVCPFVALIIVLCFLISSRRGVLKTLFSELKERFVIKKQDFKGPCIWFHAASVGEVKSIANIAADLKAKYNLPILVTTLTKAGQRAAQKINTFDCALLAPIDFYLAVKRFIKLYKPKMLIIVEADLWPNMIYVSTRSKVKVGIINGRLSERSAKRYKILKPLIKLIIPKISFICAQSEEIKKRYISLGASRRKVLDCGNIKYDALTENPNRLDEAQEIINKLGWQNSKIVVCGSTHELEENIIFNAAKSLKDVKFIIAPRHLERVKQIRETLKKTQFQFTFLSSLLYPPVESQILVADTMGLLGALYKVGTLAFVGGSIVKRGGHNFLEAAILKKPVLFGKYYYNTPDVAKALLKSGGGVLVSKANFSRELKKYLNDNVLLDKSAQAALGTAISFKGATAKTLEVIKL